MCEDAWVNGQAIGEGYVGEGVYLVEFPWAIENLEITCALPVECELAHERMVVEAGWCEVEAWVEANLNVVD